MSDKPEENLYFERDDKGSLIPQKFLINVDEVDEDVYLTPLVRGELKKIFSGIDENYDDNIILNNVKSPSYTKEEIECELKLKYSNAIVDKVFEISGIKSNKGNRKSRIEEEDEFGKKLRKLRDQNREGDMNLFLHEMCYTFLTVNSLTVWEINMLVSAFNRREQKRKVQSKGFKTQ